MVHQYDTKVRSSKTRRSITVCISKVQQYVTNSMSQYEASIFYLQYSTSVCHLQFNGTLRVTREYCV